MPTAPSADTNKESIERASYSFGEPRQQMAAFVHDVLRSSTPLHVDAVFASKEEISLQIQGALEQRFSSFGFIVVASPITEIVVEPLVQVTPPLVRLRPPHASASRHSPSPSPSARADRDE